MPLLNADTLEVMLRTYRTCWIGGRPGSFKTALAFRLAHNLLASGFSRYLISNVRSPWRDDPAKVVLRDGKYADCVCIVDEGGLFLKTGRDAESLLAFMRKLNIVLLIPSYTPPTTRLRSIEVQRTMSLASVGVSTLIYSARLNYGLVQEQMRFFWQRPSEIFGLYDTDAAASDDGGLDEWIAIWTAQLKATTKTRTKYKDGAASGFKISGGDDQGGSSAGSGLETAELSALEAQRRASETFLEAAEELSGSLSLLGKQGRKRGR